MGNIQTYLESRAQQISVILDDTGRFLQSPNKEQFAKDKGVIIDPETLDQYALIDQYFPMDMSSSFDILGMLYKKNLAIASVISTNQEIPQTRFGQFLELRGEEPFKLAIAHNYTEQDQINMLKLMHSMPQFQDQEFVKAIFNSVDDLQPRIVKAANVLTWQVINRGQVSYTDPRSGSIATLKYNVLPELFPAALTGPDSWNSYTTADGVKNLRDHSRAFYKANFGRYPDEVVLSQELCDHLLNQDSTRNHAIAQGLISATPALGFSASVDEDILAKILKRQKVPPLRIYDAQYQIEIAPGEIITGRYINTNAYSFLTAGMGKRLYVPTIENNGKPGIYVRAGEEVKSSPKEDRSYAVGRMIPFVLQPNRLAARVVIS